MESNSKEQDAALSSSGPLKGLAGNSSPKGVLGAWGIPLTSVAYQSSSAASMFSSSLPGQEKHSNAEDFDDPEHCGQSLDDSSATFSKIDAESDARDSFEDVEPSLGKCLPDDEDELLAGIMDDFDLSGLPSQLEDLEEYDLFGSGGGMELDYEAQENLHSSLSKLNISDGVGATSIGQFAFPNGAGTVAGEHPYGEHPSRTLFVRNINSNVEDSELRSLFEQYGDIRTLYTACKHRGFVMISYYDIRDARNAMRALQNKPVRRRKLDIHFSIPKDNPSEKDVNQGTLVVFNLDASVSNDDLRKIFGAYGEVKEIRETPHKQHHKFIEFYDVRASEAALKSLNRSDIAGKRIKLEPSRPGGARRSLMQQLTNELEQDDTRIFRHHIGSPVASSPPGVWAQFGSPVEHSPFQSFSKPSTLGAFSPVNGNHLPGLASILQSHVSNATKIAPIGKEQGRAGNTAFQHSRSFPDQKLSSPVAMSAFGDSNSSSSGVGTLSGPQFLWGSPTTNSEQANSSAWPTSSLGHAFPSTIQGTRRGSLVGPHQHHHHVGSAPSGVPLERHFGFFPESPNTSYMPPAPFGEVGLNRNSGNYVMNMFARNAVGTGIGHPGAMTENGSSSLRMMSMPRNGQMIIGNSSYSGMAMFGNEAFGEYGRTRRLDNGLNQIDNRKQYQLDLKKIVSGEDTRTTLMIKNIPNKYTSKMLLTVIDENHRGSYDFLYLPIDFKNKCNVGYAFINMVSPAHIIPFYEEFNGKKWEKFNSEKVASLAYARIQGKAALVMHFQNSSLMNEDKWCRPILFHSEGESTSDQEHFLSGNLNVYIRQPDGSYSGDLLESQDEELQM
ncbi:Protein MEI2-like 2 [Linum perenne]